MDYMTSGYAPSHGYWIPPHLNLATPASTIIPTSVTTPIVPTMPMPPSHLVPQHTGVMGTPAWLPGTVNSTFTPVNATYGIPVSAVPTNTAPTVVPTTPQVPVLNVSATSTPASLVVPLPRVESEDEEPPKVIMVEKRRRKSSNAKTFTRILCCGSCFIECNCSFEDNGSRTVICCACQPGCPAEPVPTAAPSSHISWQSYYPNAIYDFRHRPIPAAAPPKEKEKERHLFFLHKTKKPLTPAQWADNAARQRPLNQVQAKHFHPEGVDLHPLLNKASTSLFFNVLESKEYITLAEGGSVASIETHHATSPPVLKLELVSWLHSTPIVLENATGVTVGDVIDGILECAKAIVPGREVRSWSPERRGIVYQWYWHNRSRVHGMSRYLTIGDTFEGYTSFEGLLTSQQAKKEDRRAKELPHCTLVVSLGLDGCIPGLRSLGDFPY